MVGNSELFRSHSAATAQSQSAPPRWLNGECYTKRQQESAAMLAGTPQLKANGKVKGIGVTPQPEPCKKLGFQDLPQVPCQQREVLHPIKSPICFNVAALSCPRLRSPSDDLARAPLHDLVV
mmetsp:Transcript_25817/g.47213  ORF Transcript_25817/g.47213 Transcript_25817/m.47213 type:complete len:122 (-) Transcript_25817:330-695(-)